MNQHLRIQCNPVPEPKDIGVKKMLATLWHSVPEGVLKAEYESDDVSLNIEYEYEMFDSTMRGIFEEWKSNVIEKTKCTHRII